MYRGMMNNDEPIQKYKLMVYVMIVKRLLNVLISLLNYT